MINYEVKHSHKSHIVAASGRYLAQSNKINMQQNNDFAWSTFYIDSCGFSLDPASIHLIFF